MLWGLIMFNDKSRFMPAHARPEFNSAEWAAHVASVRAKRNLLQPEIIRFGLPKVRPCAVPNETPTLEWRREIMPAVEIYAPIRRGIFGRRKAAHRAKPQTGEAHMRICVRITLGMVAALIVASALAA